LSFNKTLSYYDLKINTIIRKLILSIPISIGYLKMISISIKLLYH